MNILFFLAQAEPAPWWQQVEQTQSLALKWIAALTVVLGALATLIGFIMAKINELKERQNRAAENSKALQAQITTVALNTPPTKPE